VLTAARQRAAARSWAGWSRSTSRGGSAPTKPRASRCRSRRDRRRSGKAGDVHPVRDSRCFEVADRHQPRRAALGVPINSEVRAGDAGAGAVATESLGAPVETLTLRFAPAGRRDRAGRGVGEDARTDSDSPDLRLTAPVTRSRLHTHMRTAPMCCPICCRNRHPQRWTDATAHPVTT